MISCFDFSICLLNLKELSKKKALPIDINHKLLN